MADAKIIDGKEISQKLRDNIAKKVPELKKAKDITPGLAVVLVGENPASKVYVRTKSKKAKEVGIDTFDHYLPHTTSQEELLSLIDKLNKDYLKEITPKIEKKINRKQEEISLIFIIGSSFKCQIT